MKKYILLLLTVFFSAMLCMAETIEEQVKKAYDAKDYDTAISLLEDESEKRKESGLESADLYYNLGNAYFRDNNLGKAILNYERAALLNPSDREIKTNLEFAYTKIEDKFAERGDFFLMDGLNAVQNLAGTNMWATFSVVLFLLFVACLAVFFFVRNLFTKKAVFYAGIVIFIFLIFTNIFAYRQKSKIENKDMAIIISKSVPAYNAPNSSDKEIFVLNPGSKVRIKKEDGDWMEVEIISGDTGWIEQDKLEII
ncbi:SH3 domain-containing protein [Dysgonomonas sp. 520]|uniref:SH3 domain-containing protein n=1 Tax=Dysgonomonas sp. 520 TaxID=2302931 RepID=UPI0013D2C132|nr:SH3 domain-containing protein [Dysgonomonas sp. 520]NDW08987.1 tetratricopeptide repeat protein [Dysgonomonas sp. 520]